KLNIRTFDLQLKHRFNIAHDSRVVQRTLIVELVQDGLSGFGEATESKYYHKPLEGIKQAIEAQRALIESYDDQEPAEFWEQLNAQLEHNSFALSAVDVAIHDLYAKKRKTSLSELWNDGTHRRAPLSNYTIGIDPIEKMVSKLREFPWPNYKIKLGTEEDVAIIQALRKETDASFRIDANCGWTADETLRNAAVMKELGVEFIEQPLPDDDWDGMKKVFEDSPLEVFADESIKSEADVERCVGHFHGINIKLMKCGGLTPALRMIRQARSLGMKVMVGCMTESSVGIMAVAQLLPLLDHIDMDGPLLIKNDLAKGPVFEDGHVHLPQGAGIGIDQLLVE
ncbi:MAG: dipeptide epimerase, partial [Bacteroidota bacterium]